MNYKVGLYGLPTERVCASFRDGEKIELKLNQFDEPLRTEPTKRDFAVATWYCTCRDSYRTSRLAKCETCVLRSFRSPRYDATRALGVP